VSETTVLVVDDERNIRDLLRMYLEQAGYRVIEAIDGQSTLDQVLQEEPPTLVVLDVMLPLLDGLEVCRQIRASDRGAIPILMLTARDDDVDKIVGLELGADDYVTKPFNPREVVARVKAILRRVDSDGAASAADSSTARIQVGDLVISPDRRRARVGDRSLNLRRKEFDLLLTLASQREIVLTREQLLEQVWGYDYFGQTRTVDVHVASLRRKLGNGEAQIETVTGVGYRLTVLGGD
jgi:DNA-binding response OmpR family regulator